MAFSSQQLKQIYDLASGYCHTKVAFKNYGVLGGRGAWEVEHSNPQAKGGTHRLNNLYPACISCNRSKGDSSAASARAKNGKSRAPLSTEKRKDAKTSNALAGGVAGAAIGALAGPFGALVGAAIGAHLGHNKNPDKT